MGYNQFQEGFNKMKGFCKALDALPKWVKVVLCLPVLDIVWAIYRIAEGVGNKNMLHVVLGILWIFVGGTVLWILDLVSILLTDRIFWFKA